MTSATICNRLFPHAPALQGVPIADRVGLPAPVRGALVGLAAAIWGLLQVSVRLAATGGVTPSGLAALRLARPG